jgi:hypothetical protein
MIDEYSAHGQRSEPEEVTPVFDIAVGNFRTDSKPRFVRQRRRCQRVAAAFEAHSGGR